MKTLGKILVAVLGPAIMFVNSLSTMMFIAILVVMFIISMVYSFAKMSIDQVQLACSAAGTVILCCAVALGYYEANILILPASYLIAEMAICHLSNKIDEKLADKSDN